MMKSVLSIGKTCDWRLAAPISGKAPHSFDVEASSALPQDLYGLGIIHFNSSTGRQMRARSRPKLWLRAEISSNGSPRHEKRAPVARPPSCELPTAKLSREP